MSAERAASIILVEDSDAVAKLVSWILRTTWTCTVEVFTLAEDALAFLESAPLPALMLVDVNLPSMAGDQMVRLAKQSHRLSPIPTVLMSAYDEPKGHYANLFIAKPFDPGALVGALEPYLGPQQRQHFHQEGSMQEQRENREGEELGYFETGEVLSQPQNLSDALGNETAIGFTHERPQRFSQVVREYARSHPTATLAGGAIFGFMLSRALRGG